MPILSLQEVSKDYLTDGQPVHALSSLSLNVERGEFVALVGRSGCGKSTLLNLAGAMDFPTSGKVLLDGVSTSSLKDSGLTQLRRERIGFIFQSFQLLHTLTAFENVELPLHLAGQLDSCIAPATHPRAEHRDHYCDSQSRSCIACEHARSVARRKNSGNH